MLRHRKRWALSAVAAALCNAAAAQSAAPYSPPKVLPVPAQRAGEVVILGAPVPVWVVPNDAGSAEASLLGSRATTGIGEAIPPPPRRARANTSIEGAAGRAEWGQPVPVDGTGVSLVVALAQLVPPGISLDISQTPAGRMQTPVSWVAGDTRANTLGALLAASALRGRMEADRLVVLAAAVAEPQPTAAQLRARGQELLAQYEAVRAAETSAWAAERSAQEGVAEARQDAAQLAREQLAKLVSAQRARESELSPRMFIVRTWQAAPQDETLRGVLSRWAAVEGLTLVYAAKIDWPIRGEQRFVGPLPQAVGSLFALLPPSGESLRYEVGPTTLTVSAP